MLAAEWDESGSDSFNLEDDEEDDLLNFLREENASKKAQVAKPAVVTGAKAFESSHWRPFPLMPATSFTRSRSVPLSSSVAFAHLPSLLAHSCGRERRVIIGRGPEGQGHCKPTETVRPADAEPGLVDLLDLLDHGVMCAVLEVAWRGGCTRGTFLLREPGVLSSCRGLSSRPAAARTAVSLPASPRPGGPLGCAAAGWRR